MAEDDCTWQEGFGGDWKVKAEYTTKAQRSHWVCRPEKRGREVSRGGRDGDTTHKHRGRSRRELGELCPGERSRGCSRDGLRQSPYVSRHGAGEDGLCDRKKRYHQT